MGKKRKHQDDSEDNIKRKIRELENKLQKKRRRISRRLPVSSDSDSEPINDTNQLSPSPKRVGYETPTRQSQHGGSPLHLESPPPSSPHCDAMATEQLPAVAVPGTSPGGEIVDLLNKELDEDILQLLGDAPKAETALGLPIHKDIANRWQEILIKGLETEVKGKLLKDYLVPNNCELLMAPTLNPEAKAALPEPLVKRDFTIMQKQKQIGIALSALATAMESILNNETCKHKILKPISDACRILCDSHYIETKTRRNFVISSINTDLKETLIGTIRDKQLFGENVTEKIKSAQTIQKSGQVLKNVPKTSSFRGKNLAYRSHTGDKNRLNFKPQHRRPDFRPSATSDAARGRPAHRQTRLSAPSRPPTTRRSPVRKTYRR